MNMTAPLDIEIRSRIAQVLSGELALRDFYYWFVPASLEVERTDDPEIIRLTHDLVHMFSELSEGLLTASDVRRTLKAALELATPSTTHQIA
jgi:hypothetical protein